MKLKPHIRLKLKSDAQRDLEKFQKAWAEAKKKLEAKWRNQKDCNTMALQNRFKLIGSAA